MTIRLLLEIDGVDYALERTPDSGWLLKSPLGYLYTVHDACSCPDSMYRRHDCKHVKALRLVGLLDSRLEIDALSHGKHPDGYEQVW